MAQGNGIKLLRTKVGKRIIKAAAENDKWSMAKYVEINRYLARLLKKRRWVGTEINDAKST